MMYETQVLWLEETEESIKAIEEAEHEFHNLGLSKTKIPKPVFTLYTKRLLIDLSMVVSIEEELILLEDAEYFLPRITLVNGEIHTLNEQTHELNNLVLEAKKQEGFFKSLVPRPIESSPDEEGRVDAGVL